MSSSVDDLNRLRPENTSREQAKSTDALKSLLESLKLTGADELSEPRATESRFFLRAKTEKLFYHVVSDVVTYHISVVLGFLIPAVLKFYWLGEFPQLGFAHAFDVYPMMFGVPLVLMVVACRQKGHYSRFKGFWEELGEFLQIALTMAGLTIAYLFFMKSDFSRLWLGTSWFLIITLVPIGRLLTKHYLMNKGRWFTPTIVIGSGDNALESALAIESDKLMGFRVVSLLGIEDLEKLHGSKTIRDELKLVDKTYPLLKLSGDINTQLRDMGHPYIVLALDADDYTDHRRLLEELAATHNNMSIIPPLRGLPLLGTEISPIFRHEVLHLRIRNNLANAIPQIMKRVFDIVLSSSLLLMLSPVFLYLLVAIGIDGGRPFYAQTRIGKRRELFKCWKFRSMHVNSEQRLRDLLADNPALAAEYQQTEKLKEDPRITKIGKLIRRYSIDELPQLWNVLKGDMSIVGPRPVRDDELERYGAQARYYLETRPGITGLWQISGRNELEYQTRVNLDAWYVRNWSLWYDIKIILKTVKVVVFPHGAY